VPRLETVKRQKLVSYVVILYISLIPRLPPVYSVTRKCILLRASRVTVNQAEATNMLNQFSLAASSSEYASNLQYLQHAHRYIARVFRRDSPPMRSRRSEGSGGESSSMLTSVEGNAVQAFSMLL
jgi:hypothetical protein